MLTFTGHLQLHLQLTTNEDVRYLCSRWNNQENKRGYDSYVDYVTLREPGVGTSVHTEPAVRTKMSKEEVTAANVRNTWTLTLLRICARNVRSVYERLWRCHVDGGKVPSLYDSKEGDGDGNSRVKELRDYVTQHVRVVEDLHIKVDRLPRSKAAWKKCIKDGGSRRRRFLERDEAVVQKSSLREQE